MKRLLILLPMLCFLAEAQESKEIMPGWSVSSGKWHFKKDVLSTEGSGTVPTTDTDIVDFDLQGQIRWREDKGGDKGHGIVALFFRASPATRYHVSIYPSEQRMTFWRYPGEKLCAPSPCSWPQKRWVSFRLRVSKGQAILAVGKQQLRTKLDQDIKKGYIALHSNGVAVDFKIKKLLVLKRVPNN